MGESGDEQAVAHHEDNSSNEEQSESEQQVAPHQQPPSDDDDDGDDWSEMKSNRNKKELFQSMGKESHLVHCPYFPEEKHEYWWIYVSDKKTSSLVTVPYFLTNLIDEEVVELKMTAPREPGNYCYMINIRSDSYLDMDYCQQIKVSFDISHYSKSHFPSYHHQLNVIKAPEVAESHPQWEDSELEEENADDDGDSAASDSDLVTSDDEDDDHRAGDLNDEDWLIDDGKDDK